MKQLLLEIAKCSNALHCLSTNDTKHPCHEIVASQGVNSHAEFQCPEPWNGHLDVAPILFISSNPSISEIEKYPTLATLNDEIADFFTLRFGGGREEWIRDGRYTLLKDGGYSNAVRFLAAVRQRAAELLDQPASEVTPGMDYALTEVVHCKSRSESGVQSAASECASRYLGRILTESVAPVVVCLGGFAGKAVRDLSKIGSAERIIGPTELGGRSRHIVFMPHPNFRGPTTFRQVVPNGLAQLRAALQN